MSPASIGLLPAFVFVALIAATQTTVSAVAIQRVSWRRPRAVDYRAVQGCMAADGVCKLLSGLAGIIPTQTIAAISVPAVQLTGVGARGVGIAAGGVLISLAFLPKRRWPWCWRFRARCRITVYDFQRRMFPSAHPSFRNRFNRTQGTPHGWNRTIPRMLNCRG